MYPKDVVDIAFDNMDGNNLEALGLLKKKVEFNKSSSL